VHCDEGAGRLQGNIMQRIVTFVVAVLALLAPSIARAEGAPAAEKRIALVIGNAAYQTGPLNTAANDAGLIAQTLQAAGFDVVGARDLDQDSLRRAFRDLLEKARTTGPDTVAFIYVSGYGVQLEGENYIVPVDARLARDTDIPVEAVRLSDYTRPLAALKLKASIVVLDAARPNSFAQSGAPLAGGLALVEPEPGMLIAFNAAPGTAAPDGQGPYGPYAQGLAEMMREGGLSLTEVFDRVRLRVNDATKGGEVPWHASQVQSQFVFLERTPDAPTAASDEQKSAFRSRPIREMGAQVAYVAALERDTLQDYQDFLAAYPGDPMAKRVRAIVAARREAITWRRTRVDDTPRGYWSYLRRYQRGPHAADARRRLAFLSAEPEPPASFAMIAYDVPPPPPEEIIYIERPVLVFDDPVYAFALPPAPPVYYLPPPPPDFIILPAPPPPVTLFILPMPEYRPVPVWVRPPVYVAPPPPNNVIFANIHNTVVINQTTNTVIVTNPAGQTSTTKPTAAAAPIASPGPRGPRGAPAAALAPVLVGPALPPSVAGKAAALPGQNPPQGAGQPSPSVQPQVQPTRTTTQPGQTQRAPLGKPLPGAAGQLLPPAPTAALGRRPGQPLTSPTGATTQPTPSTHSAPPTGRAATPPTDQRRMPGTASTSPLSRAPTSPPPPTTRPPLPPPVATRSTLPPPDRRAPVVPPYTARRPSPSPPPSALRSAPPPPSARTTVPPSVASRPSLPPAAGRPALPPPAATHAAPPQSMAPRPSPPPQAAARPGRPARGPCGAPGQPPCPR
jgi:uncharacterized caspase-like protein